MQIQINETSNTSKTKKVVGTQVSQELYDRLKSNSEAEFMSISDLLRKIIYIYYKNLDKHERNND